MADGSGPGSAPGTLTPLCYAVGHAPPVPRVIELQAVYRDQPQAIRDAREHGNGILTWAPALERELLNRADRFS